MIAPPNSAETASSETTVSGALPRHVDGLSELLPRYDAIICDVWGVLHNGLRATPGAAEALAHARDHGRHVVLLTNAPRPAEMVMAQLAGFGIGRAAYDGIVTSGAVSRDILAESGARAMFHLGPARDAPLFEGLPIPLAPLENADIILCTGLYDDETETAEDYRPILTTALGRKLPLICANPDLLVERGERLVPCAGAIADLYERMGGPVTWVGKPKPLVYDRAMDAIGALSGRPIEKSRVLCIGDALRTDVAGALAAGFDCLMVLDGIHAGAIGLAAGRHEDARLARLLDEAALTPQATITTLRV